MQEVFNAKSQRREDAKQGHARFLSRVSESLRLCVEPKHKLKLESRRATSRNEHMANYQIAQLDEIPAQRCPCGFAKRAFAGSPDHVASLHIVDIQQDARTHYHKRMTEIYLVLEGEGQMELDGQLIPVKPMTAIYIRPGCRHRAIGKLKIVNIPVPSFDESDEWFD